MNRVVMTSLHVKFDLKMKNTFRLLVGVFEAIIGASLSEPHIDRDNVPRHGECLYLSIWHAGCIFSVHCSREHAYSINNT